MPAKGSKVDWCQQTQYQELETTIAVPFAPASHLITKPLDVCFCKLLAFAKVGDPLVLFLDVYHFAAVNQRFERRLLSSFL